MQQFGLEINLSSPPFPSSAERKGVPGNPHQHAQCAGNILHKRKVIVPRGELNGAMRGRGMPGFSDECQSLSMLVNHTLNSRRQKPANLLEETFSPPQRANY